MSGSIGNLFISVPASLSGTEHFDASPGSGMDAAVKKLDQSKDSIENVIAQLSNPSLSEEDKKIIIAKLQEVCTKIEDSKSQVIETARAVDSVYDASVRSFPDKGDFGEYIKKQIKTHKKIADLWLDYGLFKSYKYYFDNEFNKYASYSILKKIKGYVKNILVIPVGNVALIAMGVVKNLFVAAGRFILLVLTLIASPFIKLYNSKIDLALWKKFILFFSSVFKLIIEPVVIAVFTIVGFMTSLVYKKGGDYIYSGIGSINSWWAKKELSLFVNKDNIQEFKGYLKAESSDEETPFNQHFDNLYSRLDISNHYDQAQQFLGEISE
jgi:hypothetical protein